MKYKFIFILLGVFIAVHSIHAQKVYSADSILINEEIETIKVERLFSDSLASTFAIAVKHEVKAHYHQFHSETILVIQGSGRMTIGDEMVEIKKGDILNIPINTVHALLVTSEEIMKVISIQAPEFLGKDRIFINE